MIVDFHHECATQVGFKYNTVEFFAISRYLLKFTINSVLYYFYISIFLTKYFHRVNKIL